MAANQKIIYVYDDFSFDEPILLGLLYITFIRGKENFSFEYDHQWLVRTMFPVDLDPEIPGFAGRHYPGGKRDFGIFQMLLRQVGTSPYEQATKGTIMDCKISVKA